MSNVNVNRSENSREAFKDNEKDYTTDYALSGREFRLPRANPLDWRIVAILVFGLPLSYALLFVVYRVWRFFYCWSDDNYYNCRVLDQREPIVIAIALAVPFVLAAVAGMVYVWTSASIRFALANRLNLVLNRFGDSEPADLHKRMPLNVLIPFVIQRYSGAQQMETKIARHKELPRGLNNYSPSRALTYNDAELDEPADDLPPDANDLYPSDPNTPLIKSLIQRGLIDRSGNSLLVGMSGLDKPHYMELDDTGLIALAGMPRVGKSITAQFIVAQIALIENATIIVCDKHGRKEKGLLYKLAPLAHLFAVKAIEPAEIVAAIDYWYSIGEQRVSEDDQRIYPPCFIVIDEFTAMILLDLLPPASLHKLISGGIEYAGVQCHGLIIGHSWTGKMLGALGTTTRRATTQRIIHRIDPQEAGLLIDPKFAKSTMSLPDGRAIFIGASQPAPVELLVPHIKPADLEYVARIVPRPLSAQIGGSGDRVSDVSDVSSASGSAETLDDDPPNYSDVSADQWSSDPRTKLAKDLLAKRGSNGKWLMSYRAVQSFTELRMSTIVAIAASIGRGNGRIDRSNVNG